MVFVNNAVIIIIIIIITDLYSAFRSEDTEALEGACNNKQWRRQLLEVEVGGQSGSGDGIVPQWCPGEEP